MAEGPGQKVVPGSPVAKCTHCGSRKACGSGLLKATRLRVLWKEGSPSCPLLFVCRGCGKVHDVGKCPMEELYNLIRQWYNPTKHAGQLPEAAEKMLN
ncbi:unnamed protein product [Peronospora effusa]|nr:unnamed protein product [Peronospora effusa]